MFLYTAYLECSTFMVSQDKTFQDGSDVATLLSTQYETKIKEARIQYVHGPGVITTYDQSVLEVDYSTRLRLIAHCDALTVQTQINFYE